jgi:ankyrin repeat protein
MLTKALTSGFCALALMMAAGNALLRADSTTVGEKDLRVASAAMQGDREGVLLLVKQKADVNTSQGDGMTALHWAAFRDDLEMARVLLAAGASAQAATRIGAMTPLFMACKNGNALMIEALLKAGADAKEANRVSGATALMAAAQSGSAPAVQVLMNHGADVNAKESAHGQTALMFAAAANRGAVIRILASAGADAAVTTKVEALEEDKLDDNGNPLPKKNGTAGQGDTVTGGNTVMGGMTALLFAARDGQLDAIRALVDTGANVNQVSAGDGSSPIVLAISNAHYEAGKYLADHGANPNLANMDGLTALYAAIDTQYAPLSWAPVAVTAQEKVSHLELMKDLLDHGADPNARLKKKLWYRPTSHDHAWTNPVGATPFWRAAYADDLAAMHLLVEHGADPKIPTTIEVTPLMAAAGVGWAPGNFSQTSPEPGAWLAAVKYCMELGLDLNAVDKQGYTALHGATYRGDNQTIEFLAERGAKLDAKAKNGWLVTDMATGLIDLGSLPVSHPDTVALLEKLGAPAPQACGGACGNANKKRYEKVTPPPVPGTAPDPAKK